MNIAKLIADLLFAIFTTGMDVLAKSGKYSPEDLAEGKALCLARLENYDTEEVSTAARLWRIARGEVPT